MKRTRVLGLLLLLMMGAASVQAQCPMCKANVSAGLESGQSNAGRGLNTGILFLLAFPYVIASGIAFVWYRNNRKAELPISDQPFGY